MALDTLSLQSIHQQNQSFTSFIFPLDHKSSLLLPQLSEFDCSYQRGPRYQAYSDLRESKLRSKRTHQEQEDYIVDPSILTPKKEFKFQRNFTSLPKRSKGSSILAQSVPDFSVVIRKENRKPSSPLLPPVAEKVATPPPGVGRRGFGNVGGSKSVNSGEKRGGSMMARKSYASIEELKGLGSIARNSINCENKVGVATRASTRNGNVLRSSRQF